MVSKIKDMKTVRYQTDCLTLRSLVPTGGKNVEKRKLSKPLFKFEVVFCHSDQNFAVSSKSEGVCGSENSNSVAVFCTKGSQGEVS